MQNCVQFSHSFPKTSLQSTRISLQPVPGIIHDASNIVKITISPPKFTPPPAKTAFYPAICPHHLNRAPAQPQFANANGPTHPVASRTQCAAVRSPHATPPDSAPTRKPRPAFESSRNHPPPKSSQGEIILGPSFPQTLVIPKNFGERKRS